tara:strand:+ start:90 stop:287 length:198 start_codon:yes stop_codon:yes gene_type:complete
MRNTPLKAFASPLKQEEIKVEKAPKKYKSKSTKVEMAHHISGLRPNVTGAKAEFRRKKYLKSLDK